MIARKVSGACSGTEDEKKRVLKTEKSFGVKIAEKEKVDRVKPMHNKR